MGSNPDKGKRAKKHPSFANLSLSSLLAARQSYFTTTDFYSSADSPLSETSRTWSNVKAVWQDVAEPRQLHLDRPAGIHLGQDLSNSFGRQR